MRYLFALPLLVACNSDAVPADARPDGKLVDAAPPRVYVQVEHLARPVIAEALLADDALLAAYNANAPGSTDIAIEAKTVLKALYLGACLINGSLTPPLTALTGIRPGGAPCHAVGPAIFDGSGNLSTASLTAAQIYADKIFGQLVPDVMRVDLAFPSTYENLCGAAAANIPLLCGGRLLQEDVVDVTYDYLLDGAATPKDAPILSRLVSDGVTFSPVEANNRLNRTSADPANAAQGHPDVTNTVFPYGASPR